MPEKNNMQGRKCHFGSWLQRFHFMACSTSLKQHKMPGQEHAAGGAIHVWPQEAKDGRCRGWGRYPLQGHTSSDNYPKDSTITQQNDMMMTRPTAQGPMRDIYNQIIAVVYSIRNSKIMWEIYDGHSTYNSYMIPSIIGFLHCFLSYSSTHLSTDVSINLIKDICYKLFNRLLQLWFRRNCYVMKNKSV